MRNSKKFFFIFIIISIVTTTAFGLFLTPNYMELTFTDGDDCAREHDLLFMTINSYITYEDSVNLEQNVSLRIKFKSENINSIIFDVSSTIVTPNDTLIIHSGSSLQIKPNYDSNSFVAEWVVCGLSDGYYPITINSDISLKAKGISDHREEADYRLVSIGGFNVLNNTNEEPLFLEPILETAIIGSKSNELINIGELSLLISQISSYASLSGFIIIAFIGIKPIQVKLAYHSSITRKRVRNWHCNLAYITIATALVHILLLLFSQKWQLHFDLVSLFIPSLNWIISGDLSSLGLDIARVAFFTYIGITVSGIYFFVITKRFGRQVALFTQKFSYLAMLAIAIHALINGTFANSCIWLRILLVIVPSTLIGLRLYYWKKISSNSMKKNNLLKSNQNEISK